MANGIDNYDASFLSKHVRPVLALLSGIWFLVMGAVIILAVINGNGSIAIAGGIMIIPAGYAGWYFGVRGQEKDKNGLKSLSGDIIKGWTNQLPKASGGTSGGGVTATPVTASEPAEPKPWVPEHSNAGAGVASETMPQPSPVKPFDQDAFNEEIIKQAKQVGEWADMSVEDMAQVSFDVFSALPPYTPKEIMKDYANAVLPYQEKWFKYAWFDNENYDCSGHDCVELALEQKSCSCADMNKCSHMTEAKKVSLIRVEYFRRLAGG